MNYGRYTVVRVNKEKHIGNGHDRFMGSSLSTGIVEHHSRRILFLVYFAGVGTKKVPANGESRSAFQTSEGREKLLTTIFDPQREDNRITLRLHDESEEREKAAQKPSDGNQATVGDLLQDLESVKKALQECEG